MKTNTWNSRILTLRPTSWTPQLRHVLPAAKAAVLALFVGLAVGCDSGGPTVGEEKRSFDIERVKVTIQSTVIHEHPSFEVTVANELDRGLDEVGIDFTYWIQDTQIGWTPVLISGRIGPRQQARQNFPVLVPDPNLIRTHEDYECYRYELQAEDADGNYEIKDYDGTCS